MSKKTKRLEKENSALTRKHEQTNRNIIEMAEERTRDKEELEKLHRQESHMRSLIKAMQEQGRGIAGADTGNLRGGGIMGDGAGDGFLGDIDDEGTESEYDEEYEDDDEEGRGPYDHERGDSTASHHDQGLRPAFTASPSGQQRPGDVVRTNGTRATPAAVVNGVNH